MSRKNQLTDLPLRDYEIHAWLACLEKSPYLIQKLATTLSSEEHKRAYRYRFEKDKIHFILSHGILRTLIGHYISKPADQLEFVREDHGKPRLRNEFGKQSIHFNFSRSGTIALYAFTRDQEIGVDVEKIRNVSDMELIVQHYFSKREKSEFFTLPECEKKTAFFNCWTRKEAYIKAIGTGLSHPLDEFDVSLNPREPPKLLGIKGDSEVVSQWEIFGFTPSSGYVAAIAIKNRRYKLKFWKWKG